ncbi:cell division protein FtsL [Brevundimonas sp. VNH65]|uniref:cell division protein FtsL n=1 Tax=Brevundimonas sp. VNH65 TaxID=3400917 RepID=UPI003C0C09C2
MTGLLATPLDLMRRLVNWKVRGIRWIEIIGAAAVAVMVLSVYVAKTAAARENARIGEIEREIAEHRQRVRLLRAEVARLEQPGRLESLSRQAGLAPVDVHRLGDEGRLPAISEASSAAESHAPAPVATAPDVPETER